MSNLQAVGNNIIVKIIDEEKKQGSIILTNDDKQYFKAKVLSVGDTVKIGLKKDDVILVKWFDQSYILDDYDVHCISEHAVIAAVKDD